MLHSRRDDSKVEKNSSGAGWLTGLYCSLGLQGLVNHASWRLHNNRKLLDATIRPLNNVKMVRQSHVTVEEGED